MKTVHIARGDSAGGSLRCAIRDAGQNAQVLSWPDDLSCGPIALGEPSERAEWWAPFYDDRDIEGELTSFWDAIAASNRLIIWFGRHRASELAFSLAWADRLGERTYDIVDVTGLQFPISRPHDAASLNPPVQSVAEMHPDKLKSLLGSERPATGESKKRCRQEWLRLKVENAPFRIVTAGGLISAPANHFDPIILERVSKEWKRIARVVGEAMAYQPYMQVGDLMLLMRVVALVHEGKILADGDPWDMRSSSVRLPL